MAGSTLSWDFILRSVQLEVFHTFPPQLPALPQNSAKALWGNASHVFSVPLVSSPPCYNMPADLENSTVAFCRVRDSDCNSLGPPHGTAKELVPTELPDTTYLVEADGVPELCSPGD